MAIDLAVVGLIIRNFRGVGSTCCFQSCDGVKNAGGVIQQINHILVPLPVYPAFYNVHSYIPHLSQNKAYLKLNRCLSDVERRRKSNGHHDDLDRSSTFFTGVYIVSPTISIKWRAVSRPLLIKNRIKFVIHHLLLSQFDLLWGVSWAIAKSKLK